MAIQDNKKPYLVELSNHYGRYFQQVQHLTEQEAMIEMLKGYNVWEVEMLNGMYVRKFK